MNYLEIYQTYRKKIKAYDYALWLISWDQETEAPERSNDYASNQLEVLASAQYDLEMAEERLEAINHLYDQINDLNDEIKIEIKKVKKSIDRLLKIPKESYIDYQVLLSKSSKVWAEAKHNNDFESFLPTLEKIVEFNRLVVKLYETDTLKGYDVLLDMYEDEMGIKEYDQFFDTLKENLVPFVLEKTKKKPKFNRALTRNKFSIEGQRAFSNYLLDVFSYDLKKGVLKESVHPFTSGVSSTDTRITTAYHEDNLISSIFSTIHEMGHAIYEQQVNESYDETLLNGGTSMGIHESQSRLYENMIGRSYEFWAQHYPKLQEIFKKELKKVTLDEFYAYVNGVSRGLIRIEADELTYSLHVMIRYEIEKQLFNGKLKVKDLPKTWNKLYRKYLGVTPKTDTEGVLQDIHWAGGSFGYFPTYALGTAYAAQIYHAMNQDIDISKAISSNQIHLINEWSKEKIHQFGGLKTPKEIMLIATKEPFDPHYYVNYLIEKYKVILKD